MQAWKQSILQQGTKRETLGERRRFNRALLKAGEKRKREGCVRFVPISCDAHVCLLDLKDDVLYDASVKALFVKDHWDRTLQALYKELGLATPRGYKVQHLNLQGPMSCTIWASALAYFLNKRNRLPRNIYETFVREYERSTGNKENAEYARSLDRPGLVVRSVREHYFRIRNVQVSFNRFARDEGVPLYPLHYPEKPAEKVTTAVEKETMYGENVLFVDQHVEGAIGHYSYRGPDGKVNETVVRFDPGFDATTFLGASKRVR